MARRANLTVAVSVKKHGHWRLALENALKERECYTGKYDTAVGVQCSRIMVGSELLRPSQCMS